MSVGRHLPIRRLPRHLHCRPAALQRLSRLPACMPGERPRERPDPGGLSRAGMPTVVRPLCQLGMQPGRGTLPGLQLDDVASPRRGVGLQQLPLRPERQRRPMPEERARAAQSRARQPPPQIGGRAPPGIDARGGAWCDSSTCAAPAGGCSCGSSRRARGRRWQSTLSLPPGTASSVGWQGSRSANSVICDRQSPPVAAVATRASSQAEPAGLLILERRALPSGEPRPLQGSQPGPAL